MADVLQFNTADGGEIEILNGRPTMTNGLETAAYLSLFGGNERDGGIAADDHLQWWGNLGETEPARRYRSETQHLLRALPAITANLRRVEAAAGRDLAWMVGSVAEEVVAVAGMPGRNRVALDIRITVDGKVIPLRFEEPWSPT